MVEPGDVGDHNVDRGEARVIVSKVHLIRLADLDTAAHAPVDAHVRIELGDASSLTYDEEHRLRMLAWGGKFVQIVGTNPYAVDSLESFLADYAYDEALS